jgi:type III restriction enzyme
MPEHSTPLPSNPQPLRIDRGARFYRCDFQVHTPRDLNWAGEFSTVTSETDRKAYAKAFVNTCRKKEINGVAITDHHDLCLFPYVREAAAAEVKPDGTAYLPHQKLVVFPGIELTLSLPSCQALVLFDPRLSDAALQQVWGALGVAPFPPDAPKIAEVRRLGTDKDLPGITKALGALVANPEEAEPAKRYQMKDHFILLPHVRKHGMKSLLRDGMHTTYAEMPCVGGYIEGRLYSELEEANRDILEGKKLEYGCKKVAVFQTSDCREARKVTDADGEWFDFINLGAWPTWVKWTEPSAEALRQACLASASRIAHTEPQLPSHRVCSVKVSNSKFLGQLELSLNPQFNGLIGGRGTGKSTLLEYIRWALCDDPRAFDPSLEATGELPDFQRRRKGLVEKTLKALDATVTVAYEKYGVIYSIMRSSLETNDKLLVTSPDGSSQEMTGEQVRREFPVVSYAQKQLSSVGTLPDEVLRIVTDPVRDDVSRINEDLNEVVLPMLKEERQKQLRLAELRLQQGETEEKARLLREQIQGLQSQLGQLTSEQQKVLDEHTPITTEKQWLDTALGTLESFHETVSTAKAGLEYTAKVVPLEIGDLTLIADGINAVRMKAIKKIGELETEINGSAALADDVRAAVDRVMRRYNDHEVAYKECVEVTAKSKQQLADIERLNGELANLGQRIGTLTTQIQGLSVPPDQKEPSAWTLWIEKHQKRALLLQEQCRKISGIAQDAFRATLRPYADTKNTYDTLDRYIQHGYDIRRREEKVRNLCRIIAAAPDPLQKWQDVVAEFDALVRSTQNPKLPDTPILLSADFTAQNLKTLQAVEPQEVEAIRYLPLKDRIEFEFPFGSKPDGSPAFIPFQDASPGQQATALMRTLLADEGPPLLIDQPEEDLDNEQIRAIADRIAETKHNRQLIFVSHNANIVVNGDAELVIHFDYARSEKADGGIDRTRGIVERTGSIDFPPIKDIITSVMEGGREAFELRRQKYGF